MVAKAHGSYEFGMRLQQYVKRRFEEAGIPLRECAGSGNQHRSDSDLTNRILQIECKARHQPDGIHMPKKADWKKLKGEASGANRVPLRITSARFNPLEGDVLITLRLNDLLHTILGEDDAW